MVKTKKISALEEMKITTDWIYCIYPFSGFDKNNRGIFKIGITSKKFHERLDSHYHTYFPAGFYYYCFLQQPEKSEDNERTLLKFYGEIEQFIFANIKMLLVLAVKLDKIVKVNGFIQTKMKSSRYLV